jgi:hypothetical protein
MSETSHNENPDMPEHSRTWASFMRLIKWGSLATFWIVGMLITVLGLNLPLLAPLVVLTALCVALAYVL